MESASAHSSVEAGEQKAPHPTLLERRIIHIDMDAFYAAVEVLDHPEYRGVPLIVGGQPDSRGVVATASYEARRYGIRSAMPSAHAARLCPHALFIKPRFERYRQVSITIRDIMRRYTDLLEPLSLDEAFIDVTDNLGGLYAVQIAQKIRADIARELGLTASAGVAPNKMLAKIASELRKPNGLSVITPEQVESFMPRLSLAKIHGIGPVSLKKLAHISLVTCGDVQDCGESALQKSFGETFGSWLWLRAHGLDDRRVETARVRKSMGAERTFARDLSRREDMIKALRSLGSNLADEMSERSLRGRTITLKVRYPNFQIATRATSLEFPTNHADLIVHTAIQLLDKTAALKLKVRLLGISVKLLNDSKGGTQRESSNQRFVQRSLFDD